MYLYLVKRTDWVNYVECGSVVIRAETKDRAFEIATNADSDFPHRAFYQGFKLDGSNLTVTCIGKALRQHKDEGEGEVLASFNAG